MKMANFTDTMNVRVANLVKNAEIHKETHLINFTEKGLPDGITNESLKTHVDFINETSVAVGQAVAEIAQTQYPDSKHLAWDGHLQLGEGLSFSAGHQLKEEVGDEVSFGVSEVLVDYTYNEDLAKYWGEMQDLNAKRGADLFKSNEA